MLDGKVDISTVAPTPIMFNSFKREDFLFSQHSFILIDDVKCAIRKASTPADLKGKKVGTPAGTTGQFFLMLFCI